MHINVTQSLWLQRCHLQSGQSMTGDAALQVEKLSLPQGSVHGAGRHLDAM